MDYCLHHYFLYCRNCWICIYRSNLRVRHQIGSCDSIERSDTVLFLSFSGLCSAFSSSRKGAGEHFYARRVVEGDACAGRRGICSSTANSHYNVLVWYATIDEKK